MRGTDIAGKMKTIAQNYKTSYIWGGIGQPITDTSITQAVNQYKDNLAYASRARKLIGQKAFAFDCVGTIKAILWGWSGDSSKSLRRGQVRLKRRAGHFSQSNDCTMQ